MREEERRSPAVENWLGRLGETTAKNYRSWWSPWVKWLRLHGGEFKDMSPDELIAYQQHTGNGERHKILDLSQRYVLSLTDKRVNTKRNYYRMIRSFFRHNRAELPSDSAFILRGDLPKVVGKLTVENVRDLVNRSNPLYRAVIMSMFQGGMGLEEFDYWSLHGKAELVEQLRAGVEVVKVSLPGRKKNKNEAPYFTLLGRDSVEAIRAYLGTQSEGQRRGRSIFYNQTGTELRKKTVWYYWRRNLEAMGLIVKKGRGTGNRYGLNPHELRDLFRSQWEKSGAAGTVAEYCMGHVVDAYGYNKAAEDEDWARGEYEKAEPYLNLISDHETPYGIVKESEARKKLKAQGGELQALREDYTLLKETLRQIQQRLDQGVLTAEGWGTADVYDEVKAKKRTPPAQG